MRSLGLIGVIGCAASLWSGALCAMEFPTCKDTRDRVVEFVSEPSESGMMNASADYRRDCDRKGHCRMTPIVIYNPKHPYLENPVMARFTLLHECGHHAHGDPLRKVDPDEPLETFIGRESKADCYAARRGKAERRLSCGNIRAVSRILANAGRLTEKRRAARLLSCARDVGCP